MRTVSDLPFDLSTFLLEGRQRRRSKCECKYLFSSSYVQKNIHHYSAFPFYISFSLQFPLLFFLCLPSRLRYAPHRTNHLSPRNFFSLFFCLLPFQILLCIIRDLFLFMFLICIIFFSPWLMLRWCVACCRQCARPGRTRKKIRQSRVVQRVCFVVVAGQGKEQHIIE